MDKLTTTAAGDLTLWHTVPVLGAGVADNIGSLIKWYAQRAGLRDLPPTTLQGPGWDKPWEELVRVEGCGGNSGPSDEEVASEGVSYSCLVIWLPSSQPDALPYPEPRTIEGVIAHEVCHLRWTSLPHFTQEFTARVLALLRGATFPSRGGWSQRTKQIMQETRSEAMAWYVSTFRAEVCETSTP